MVFIAKYSITTVITWLDSCMAILFCEQSLYTYIPLSTIVVNSRIDPKMTSEIYTPQKPTYSIACELFKFDHMHA